MKAFLISYNRLTSLKKMAEYLTETGCDVYIIDNNSTYKPLLKWLDECPYQVIRLMKNWGHQVLWNECKGLTTDRYYIVSDPDLDISHIPTDYKEVLQRGLELFPKVYKAGFSLRINDLPENNYTKEVISWERKFWETEKRHGFYLSDIDTTFAMYDSTRDFGKLPNNDFFKAVRADEPYTAKHLPWELTKENMTEEDEYYLKNTNTYWATIFKEKVLNL